MIIEKVRLVDAVCSLKPNVTFKTDGDLIAEWDINNTNETQPTEAEIDAEIIRLQAEYDAQAYARARQPLYPVIGDQLDDLYHKGAFSAEMTATLKKVKDDNPK